MKWLQISHSYGDKLTQHEGERPNDKHVGNNIETDVHSLPTTHSTGQQLVGCVCIKRQSIVRCVFALTPRTVEIEVVTISADQGVIPFPACLWRVVDVSSGGMFVSGR